MLQSVERRFPLAKSSKSSKDDKKQKSKGGLVTDGRASSGGVWVKRDSASGGFIEGGAVRDTRRDGSGSFKITIENGQVFVATSSKPKPVRSTLPAAEVFKFGTLEKVSQHSSVSPDNSSMLLGVDTAEFKAGLERMAKYHAKTKALFSSLMKANADAVFSGALAGNVRKNKSKKKSHRDESVEIKKAH